MRQLFILQSSQLQRQGLPRTRWIQIQSRLERRPHRPLVGSLPLRHHSPFEVRRWIELHPKWYQRSKFLHELLRDSQGR